MTITVGGTSITFNDGTTQTTAAGIPSFGAGSNYYNLNSGAVNYAGGSSFSLKDQMRVLVSGTYRICAMNYAPWGPSCGVANIIKFYKNGVAISGEYSTLLTSQSLVTFDATLAAGDKIQLYSRNSFGSGYSNQGALIGYGLSVSNITNQLWTPSYMPIMPA